jgi:uncharacterized membrane protein SirB2
MDTVCAGATFMLGFFFVPAAHLIVMDPLIIIAATENNMKMLDVLLHINAELLVARFILLATGFAGLYTGLFATVGLKPETASDPNIFTVTALFIAMYVAIDFITLKYSKADKTQTYHNKWRFFCAAMHASAQSVAFAVYAVFRDVPNVGKLEMFARFGYGGAVSVLCVAWGASNKSDEASLTLSVVTLACQTVTGLYVWWKRGLQYAFADMLLLLYLFVLVTAEHAAYIGFNVPENSKKVRESMTSFVQRARSRGVGAIPTTTTTTKTSQARPNMTSRIANALRYKNRQVSS